MERAQALPCPDCGLVCRHKEALSPGNVSVPSPACFVGLSSRGTVGQVPGLVPIMDGKYVVRQICSSQLLDPGHLPSLSVVLDVCIYVIYMGENAC